MAAAEQPEKHGNAMHTLIAEVGQLVEKQRYAACTALLDGAAQPGDTAAAATLQQQRLICSILLHAQRNEWWQVCPAPRIACIAAGDCVRNKRPQQGYISG